MFELIPTIATSFTTAMLTNAFSNAQGPAQALDDLMALSGFEKLHLYAEKKRAKTEIYIQSYKEAIAQELIQIPEENIQEPQMSIVGPALEASKYYIQEKEIREMFAKIIAGSMDSRKSPNIHHSFVEVIKQLNKDDAVFLNEFSAGPQIPSLQLFFTNSDEKDRKHEEYLKNRDPLIRKIELLDINSIASIPFLDIYYCSDNCNDFDKNIFTISNLIRLGIADNKQSSFSNEEIYNYQIDKFEDLKYSDDLQTSLNYLNTHFNDVYALKNKLTLIELTPFGKLFCEVCL